MFNVQALRIKTADKTLVNGLDFTMQAGERWVILGANGCGKSSLLYACAGMPQAGRQVSLAAMKVVGQTFTQRMATLAALAPLRSLCPQRLDWNTALSPKQLSSLLKIPQGMGDMGLPQTWLNQALAMRSGGEQQRIALALTLAQSAPMCFLDEPLTYLDEVQQAQALTAIKASGKTVLMVSHHTRLSLAWATHCIMPTALGTAQGQWLFGAVAQVATIENLAIAYGIDVLQARRLWA